MGEAAVTEEITVLDAEREADNVGVWHHGADRASREDAAGGRPTEENRGERQRGGSV